MVSSTLVSFTLLLIDNMSDQCAVAPDGSLKDAADIQWYNDPDDSAPIPSASRLSTASASSSAQSLAKFLSSHPPAKKVSGERHSSRVRKPSKRTTDPDNAETAGDTFGNAQSGQKRKASTANVSRRVSRKVVESDANSNSASDDDNQSDVADTEAHSDEDPDETHATANYERMKALGDDDRKVMYFHLTVDLET
jgi:hypothetical protein